MLVQPRVHRDAVLDDERRPDEVTRRPALKERRKELVKVVKHEAENARVAVRNLRRDAIQHLKDALKKHEVSENDERRALDEMQKATDRHIAGIEKLLQEKEKELLAV